MGAFLYYNWPLLALTLACALHGIFGGRPS
jgi:hypothetical protein